MGMLCAVRGGEPGFAMTKLGGKEREVSGKGKNNSKNFFKFQVLNLIYYHPHQFAIAF